MELKRTYSEKEMQRAKYEHSLFDSDSLPDITAGLNASATESYEHSGLYGDSAGDNDSLQVESINRDGDGDGLRDVTVNGGLAEA